MTHTFPGGLVIKNPPVNAGDKGSIPGPEDSMCCRATKSMPHNYWAGALEPTCHNYWAHVPRAPAPQQEKPLQGEACALQPESSPCLLQLEKLRVQQEDPAQPKLINKILKTKVWLKSKHHELSYNLWRITGVKKFQCSAAHKINL